ncbi:hypothetical protein NXX91_22300 [Bacteroides thetaiotaomicron]|nr:hypothetical protein [Bacteroides thetaiotaomicron]
MKKHPLPEKTRENIRTALRRDTREGFLHELAGKRHRARTLGERGGRDLRRDLYRP